MNKYKKIVSGWLVSSILLGNIPLSMASDDVKPSAEEVKKVESQIVSLQSNLFDNSKTILEQLSSEFKKVSTYEEKGTSRVDLMVDQEMIGKANASFKLDNYNVKSSGFDSEMSSDVSLTGDYQPAYGSGFEFNLKAFASLISKDSEIYALLKDFNFKVNNQNVDEVLEKVKEQFKDNTYVKIPSDEASQAALTFLKSFDTKSFLSQADAKLQLPFLTPYKKVGSKYLLVPTQHACDTYFELEQKLNFSDSWYTPQTCTETVYKKVLSDFTKNGELSITLGENENTLEYYMIDKEEKTVFDLQIKYTDSEITHLDLSIVPDQTQNKGEGFYMNYSKNEFLKANLYAEKGKYKMNFTSELDENNYFKEIQGSINLDKEVVGNVSLKDNKLNSFVTIKQKGYDYNSENWDYVLKNVYAIKMNGILDAKNQITSLVTRFAGVDVTTKKSFLLGKLTFSSGAFTTYLKYDDVMGSFVTSGKGVLEDTYLSYDSTFDYNNTYKGSLFFELDLKNNKNDAKINLIINNGDKKIFTFNFFNQAKREYKDNLKVEAPKEYNDFTDIKDAYNDPYSDDYSDDASDEYNEDYLDEFEEIQ